MTLPGPLSCRRVVAFLLTASVLCAVAWWLGLLLWVLVSRTLEINQTAGEVISYTTLFGFSAIAYAVILRQSAWFFSFRPVTGWAASIVAALTLMFMFVFVFQIAFSLYAGW
jgi:hypothetical protein